MCIHRRKLTQPLQLLTLIVLRYYRQQWILGYFIESEIIYNINNFEFIWFVRELAQQHVVDFILGVDLSGDNTRAKTSRLSLHWSEERMIKTAVVSLLVLPHFIAYPANKYEKLARINRYRSLGRFIIQNSQQLQLQQSWSIQLTSKSMLGAQKVCEGTQCVDGTVL